MPTAAAVAIAADVALAVSITIITICVIFVYVLTADPPLYQLNSKCCTRFSWQIEIKLRTFKVYGRNERNSDASSAHLAGHQ